MPAAFLVDDLSISLFWHHCQEQYNLVWCPMKCSLGKFTREIRACALLDSKPLCTYLSKRSVNSNEWGLKHSLSSIKRFTADHFQCIKKWEAKPWGLHIIFSSFGVFCCKFWSRGLQIVSEQFSSCTELKVVCSTIAAQNKFWLKKQVEMAS